MVNLKIVSWSYIGASQETKDRADQAEGLSEENGVFGALTCSR